MTNEAYRASPGLSNSDIKLLLESPHDFKHRVSYETEAMRAGTRMHCYILEREAFRNKYYIAPDVRKGTKEWKEIEAKASTKEIIKRSDFKTLMLMKKSLKQSHWAARLLNAPGGKAEVVAYFDFQGQPCKLKADWLVKVGNLWFIVDLKKIGVQAGRSLTEKAIQRYISDFKCHRQAAFYRIGLHRTLDIPLKNIIFVNIFVEEPSDSKTIGACVTAAIPDEDLDEAEIEIQDAIARYQQYETNGYPSTEEFITLEQVGMGIIKTENSMPSIGKLRWAA